MNEAINISSIKWLLKNIDNIKVTDDINEWEIKDIEISPTFRCIGAKFSSLVSVEGDEYSLGGGGYEHEWKSINIQFSTYLAKRIYNTQKLKWFNLRQCFKLAKIILNSTCGLPDIDFRLKDNRRLYTMIEKSFINDILYDILLNYNGDYIGYILDIRAIYLGMERYRDMNANWLCDKINKELLEGKYV